MATAPVERTGVVQDEVTGETYLPATRRPDGTWRKPRRVKDGYVPQEEMPVYENKGVTWLKSKPSLPPGMNPDDVKPTSTCTNKPTEPMSKSAKKNAKRKEKKKQQELPPSIQSLSKSMQETNISNFSKQTKKSEAKPESKVNETTGGDNEKQDITKKLRTLRKKLKQIEDLERRISSEELKEPEKEQLEKISKKDSVLSEIEDLELELDDL